MGSATFKNALQTTQAVGPLISAGGTIAGGIERQNEANAQADQLERNAGAAKAVGQRNALNTDLMTRLTQSRQVAMAAASGGGVANPTVEGIVANTGARGEYARLTDLYNGDSTAQDLMMRAAYTRSAGNKAMAQTAFDATKTLAGGATTLIDRYGGKLPPWMGGTASYDPATDPLADGG